MKQRSDLKHKLEPPDLEADETADERQLFRQAMEGVRPLRGRPRSTRLLKPAVEVPPLILPSDVMREAFQELGEVDWPFAPGYVEGGELQWNRKLLRKLRNGKFSIQAELDLHGLTRPEARLAVGEFLSSSAGRGLRCVRVVHGQGPGMWRIWH